MCLMSEPLICHGLNPNCHITVGTERMFPSYVSPSGDITEAAADRRATGLCTGHGDKLRAGSVTQENSDLSKL